MMFPENILNLRDQLTIPRLPQGLFRRPPRIESRPADLEQIAHRRGREALSQQLGPDVDLVIVELGANDALRGIDPQATESNLAAILEALATRGAETSIQM